MIASEFIGVERDVEEEMRGIKKKETDGRGRLTGVLSRQRDCRRGAVPRPPNRYE